MIKVQMLIDKDLKNEVIHGRIREMLSSQPGAASQEKSGQRMGFMFQTNCQIIAPVLAKNVDMVKGSLLY